MKKLFKFGSLLSLAFFSPIMAFAQVVIDLPSSIVTTDVCASLVGIGNLICKANQILKLVIPLLMALGLIYFIWGVTYYVIGGDEEKKKKGREQMIYGIIGLTVITSVWGLMNIIVRTFKLEGTAPILKPLTAFGTSATCDLSGNPTFQDLLCYITKIINNSVIPLIFALALVMFVWGVVQFVIKSDEETKKEKGKQFMLWGIIALTVMVSVWGLVEILGATFKVKTDFIPQVKQASP